MKKQAFTLIELLVVIAIIAILAAILFPVFAQAKLAAKKTQGLSNLKNLGTAANIYLADYDDVLPQGTVYVPSINSNTSNRFVPTPASLAPPLTSDPDRINAANAFVFNAMQPYTKNLQILQDPTAQRFDGGTFSMLGGVKPPLDAPDYTYTYNGLLNAYSATAVTAVSSTIMFWPGQGKRSLIGGTYASPWLNCNNLAAPCVYVPPSSTCSVSNNGQSSSYTRGSTGVSWDMYGKTSAYVYTDSHAKVKRVNVGGTGDADPRTDPFARYDSIRPTHRYWDQFFCHPYIFRPDLDHQTWDNPIIFP